MEYIQFADENVKQVLLDNGVGSNGEISYDDAASVMTIRRWFRENTDITSFDELQYFTNLQTIENGAFYGCTNLQSITLPETINTIQPGAFQLCGFESFVVPRDVFIIEESTFSHCYSLSSITLPNGLKTIGNGAFFRCESLQNIDIPDSVCILGKSAFRLSGLQAITLPSGITEIDTDMFRGCQSLTSVNLPNTITSIGLGAFFQCKGLHTLKLPNSVTEIKSYAFFECTNLQSIIIPDGVSYLGQETFCDCVNLTNVALPYSLTSIGDNCFEGCRNIQTMTFPNNVSMFGRKVFSGCAQLSPLYFNGNTAPISTEPDTVFEGTPVPIAMYVPTNAVNSYNNTQPFSDSSKFIIVGCEKIQTPSIVPNGGIIYYNSPIELSTNHDATIYYTINGDRPTPDANVYTEPIIATEDVVVKAYGIKNGYIDSDVATAEFSIKLREPVITPSGGTMTQPLTVTITADPEFTVHYTLNGGDPTVDSPIYTGPFVIANTCTIKAITVGEGYIPSNVAIAKITKVNV